MALIEINKEKLEDLRKLREFLVSDYSQHAVVIDWIVKEVDAKTAFPLTVDTTNRLNNGILITSKDIKWVDIADDKDLRLNIIMKHTTKVEKDDCIETVFDYHKAMIEYAQIVNNN